ncbi:MAG: hydrolase [Alphaproteobacteria bacterium]
MAAGLWNMPIEKKPQRAWQRMLSGRRLDLLDPSPLDIEIEDIAHGLARIPCWNGQTIGAYPFSVAQHSLLVCDLVDYLSVQPLKSAQLTTLLHDAPEYVISDLITPFKKAIGQGYKTIEHRLSRAIFLRFGLPAAAPEILQRLIKQADRLVPH